MRRRKRQVSRDLNYTYGSPEKRRSDAGERRGGHTIFDPNEDILMPHDVSQAMLDKVADRSGGKVIEFNKPSAAITSISFL